MGICLSQNDKLRRLTLGLYPTVSLAIARVQAAHARASKHQGEDPVANAIQERITLKKWPITSCSLVALLY